MENTLKQEKGDFCPKSLYALQFGAIKGQSGAPV
jgi:hypothetical protein